MEDAGGGRVTTVHICARTYAARWYTTMVDREGAHGHDPARVDHLDIAPAARTFANRDAASRPAASIRHGHRVPVRATSTHAPSDHLALPPPRSDRGRRGAPRDCPISRRSRRAPER